jgi:hypothetical protein
MRIYAIDPGYQRSAMVCLDDTLILGGCALPVCGTWLEENEAILALLNGERKVIPPWNCALVIEQIESFGMPVGREVFETVFWAGRFVGAWQERKGDRWALLPRRAVKLALCGSMKATDATIRQALIDRYGPSKEKAIGRKASPGPLYGLKADLWSALALGVTYLDQRKVA